MWNSGGTQQRLFLHDELFSSPTTFTGVHVYALDRCSMLTGGPANAIRFAIPAAGLGDSYSLVAANFAREIRHPPAEMKCCWLSTARPLAA